MINAERASSSHIVLKVLVLVLVIGLGVALRLYLAGKAFYSTFDTSTPGLMALRILDGERPLFYYGQNYMGALEAYLAALIFAVSKPGLLSLALSPILFSVGWMASMFLLFRELFHPRAGWAALLVTAFPCWHALWYSMGSYGGYPAALMFGTLSLWLVVRLYGRELSNRSEWVHVLSLGLLAGLGIWTHYLSATYLAVGFILVVKLFIRRKWARDLLVKFLAGGSLFLLGVSPCLSAFGKYGGSQVVATSFRPADLFSNLSIFMDRILPKLVLYSPGHPAWIRMTVLASLCFATGITLACIIKYRRHEESWRLWIPTWFLGLFFLMYLPNGMAEVGAPRYTITLASIITSTVYAVPIAFAKSGLRKIGWVLLGIWALYNGGSGVWAANEKHEDAANRIAARERILSDAKSTGAEWVHLIGSPIFGLRGQTYTFAAQDQVRFVSCYDERHQPSAQAIEARPDAILACEDDKLGKVSRAVHELGGRFLVIDGPAVGILHDLEIPDEPRVSVQPQVKMLGVPGHLSKLVLDRDLDSSVTGPYGEGGLLLDFGEPVRPHSLWLLGEDVLQQDVPESYLIEASDDGQNFREIHRTRKRMIPSFSQGGKVFIKGYLGRTDIHLPDVEARYFRIRFQSGLAGASEWTLAEVYVFRRDDAEHMDSLDALEALIREHEVTFTFSDRVMSARLLERLGLDEDHPAAYPRYNPKFMFTQLSRELEPRPGVAVAVTREIAEDTEAFLRGVFGSGVVGSRHELGRYTCFLLADPEQSPPDGKRVIWNGHGFLLKSGEEPRWY